MVQPHQKVETAWIDIDACVLGCAVCCGPACVVIRMQRQVAERSSGNRKYASRADKDRHYLYLRRARLASAVSESIAAKDIFDRDGWRCGICGEKVDKRLKWPAPRSASLDHIVPISAGGTHVRSNVQCAHLGCNSRKRDGAGGQLRLFG